MGCVVSKDLRSPSAAVDRTSSWKEPIHKASAIPTNRSLKMISGGGYITAIFSTKNGVFGRNARVKDMDGKAFTQTISKKESCLKGRSCRPNIKRVADAHVILTADMLNSISGALMMSGPELFDPPKPAKITSNVETINMSELMQGLAEKDGFANSEDRQWANHKFSHLSNFLVEPEHSSSLSMKSTSAKHRPFPARRSARILRSKSWPSIRNIESCEVDLTLFKTQVKMMPALKSLRKGLMQEKDLGNLPFIENTSLKSTVKQSDGIDDANTDRCISANSFEDLSYGSCGTLQKALSFKHMADDNNCKIPSLSTDTLKSDSLRFATHECWLECGSKIFPSTPDLSVSASFKDWLHNSWMHADNSPCNAQSSIPDTCQSFQFTSEAPEYYPAHDGKPLHSLCTDSVENQWPSSPYQDGTNQDDFGSPIFDPDMVDSFEAAIRCLSTDEWDAVRGMEDSPIFDSDMVDSFEAAVRCLSKDEWDAVSGMEDSPQNFLRLALKKSGSDCVRNQEGNTANLGLCAIMTEFNSHIIAADYCGPSEPTNSKYHLLQRKRHSSFDIEKSGSQERVSDGRAMPCVVFYSSKVQVCPKAYEDCNQVRSILDSLVGIGYDERSVSELEENAQELRGVLGTSFVLVPTICVKGKCLVGIDSILNLYQKGLLGLILNKAAGFLLEIDAAMQWQS